MSRRIKDTFSRISGSYDRMNHMLSLGIDILWRRRAAEALLKNMQGAKRYSILDAATGTGDLAIGIERLALRRSLSVSITAQDFNKEMLSLARSKASRLHCKNILFEEGDALHMRYGNASFDAVASAFALRNFDSIAAFSDEVYRVLRKRGSFVFLDMALPRGAPGRAFFRIYSLLMKAAGSAVDRDAYAWLVKSIEGFDRKGLRDALSGSGFSDVGIEELPSGIAFIASGYK